MAKIFIEETTLTSIGDAIRGKEGSTELVPVNDMATRITNLPSGGSGGNEPTDEELTISGKITNLNYQAIWDWFFEKYQNKISTKDLLNADSAFNATKLTQIPFAFNFDATGTRDVKQMFMYAYNLTSIGDINNLYTYNMMEFFNGCNKLRYLPKFNNFKLIQSGYNNSSKCFFNCYSLRAIDDGFKQGLNHSLNTYSSSASYGFYYQLCKFCYNLDEIIELPCFTKLPTSNCFTEFVQNCYRLKDFTFALVDNVPAVASWKSQTINLSIQVGYATAGGKNYILNYNSGITADKEVTDDATYQALKNDPDWWTKDIAYSRYNHDSAVATINSLPDTSAYIAANGGTNTIKFKGEAGSATDGGAINTLTEEEIAVATAKGWTVTLA